MRNETRHSSWNECTQTRRLFIQTSEMCQIFTAYTITAFIVFEQETFRMTEPSRSDFAVYLFFLLRRSLSHLYFLCLHLTNSSDIRGRGEILPHVLSPTRPQFLLCGRKHSRNAKLSSASRRTAGSGAK